MRRALAALTIAGLPLAFVTTTAAPAAAYECEMAISEDIVVDCNACHYTEPAINGISRKLTGQDLVHCLD